LRSPSSGRVLLPEVADRARAESLEAKADALVAARTDLCAAMALYDTALTRGADLLDIAGRQWRCAMLLGDFTTAWRISDAVLTARRERGLSCAGQPYHLRWLWDGQPLEGRHVLVRCYHGLGDVLQFIRFAEPLRRLASRVTVQAVAPLLPLLRSVRDIDAVVPLCDGEGPCHDIEIELMELPHALRVSVATIPRRVPYLTVDRDRVRARRAELGRPGRAKVGVVWAAGAWKPERSVPLELMLRLCGVADVDFVNLQRGPALAELDTLRPDPSWIEWGKGSADLLETATTIAALDLVISVDTMIAHLAGALAVPVWTLLHSDADWRWLAGREASPWYPTMRLFRQTRAGDWHGVIADVNAALSGQATFR
jgi:hypothetical protein